MGIGSDGNSYDSGGENGGLPDPEKICGRRAFLAGKRGIAGVGGATLICPWNTSQALLPLSTSTVVPQKKHAEDSSAPCKTASPGDTCYKAPEKSHKNARVFLLSAHCWNPACFFLDLKKWAIEKISLICMENDVLFFGLKCRQGCAILKVSSWGRLAVSWLNLRLDSHNQDIIFLHMEPLLLIEEIRERSWSQFNILSLVWYIDRWLDGLLKHKTVTFQLLLGGVASNPKSLSIKLLLFTFWLILLQEAYRRMTTYTSSFFRDLEKRKPRRRMRPVNFPWTMTRHNRKPVPRRSCLELIS